SAPAATPARPQALALDTGRMAADIGFLADDDFHGRYTLSPDLRRAAEFLAQRYGELGLVPIGSSFAIDFPLRTGARLTQAPGLELRRGKKTTSIAVDQFVALPQSGSGTVRGELVFVGYAARSELEEKDGKTAAAPAYDDLAGVDLQGKVALVLLEAPGRPDPMVLFKRLQQDAQQFSDAAAPLKAAADLAGLRKLHEGARLRLTAMLESFLPPENLAKVWPLPEDPLTLEFDLQKIVGGLMREAANLPGPRFGMAEGGLKTKVERLAKAGAIGVIAVRGPRSFVSPEERDADALPTLDGGAGVLGEALPIPVVQIKWKSADKLLGKRKLSRLQEEIDRARVPRSGPLPGLELALSVAIEPVQTLVPNVLASLPGSDRAQEIVLIGAHYDHIGQQGLGQCSEARSDKAVDGICNGADDNASGTAMVLELARAYKQSGRAPQRTIVFVNFAGEELGVLGSKALAEAPPFDLKRVVAMVNLDMVGRLGPKGLAIGGLGSSDAWMPLLDQVGTAGLEILYESSVATRSDHASFYRKDIPVLFFFTGVHSDYHRPGDHTDKINLVGMGAIGQIVGGVTMALGDGLAVPWKPAGERAVLSQGLPGSDPATVVKRVKASD
ncbi:MAG: M20/M25/M40 family metallo-hydrolase, partial [Nannocystis sp.]